MGIHQSHSINGQTLAVQATQVNPPDEMRTSLIDIDHQPGLGIQPAMEFFTLFNQSHRGFWLDRGCRIHCIDMASGIRHTHHFPV